MTPKRVLTYGGIAAALGLALWLDPVPQDPSTALVNPVVRPAGAETAAEKGVEKSMEKGMERGAPRAEVPSGEARLPRATAPGRADAPPPRLLALRDRAEMFGGAASQDAPMFRARGWAPPPAPAAAASGPEAPPLPFTYVGKQQVGAEWRVFLQDSDDIHIVRARDAVAGGYRVLTIQPPTMTLEHLATHTVQTLEIE